LGGEKLYRVYTILFAALLTAAGLFTGNLATLSAQAQEAPDSADPAAPPADGPSPESFIVFDAAEEDGEIAAPETLSGFTALRMVLVLALCAAAIYGVVFFFRRLAKPPAAANPYLKTLARLPLGGGGSVAVVSLGTRAWLVGAGDGGVSLIAELLDQELVDAMILDYSRNGSGNGAKLPAFAALLRRLGGGAEERRLGADDLRRRRERLNRL
jgi:flagellar protein FliO/FliZ